MPDLLLELRSEEIPARMQRKAAGDLRKLVTDGLVDAGLTYEGAQEYWTPRRLVLDVRGVTARSRDVREERKGPSTKAPEQAIQGFLRSAGLNSVDEAEVKSDPKKGDFYVAVISKPGRAAEEIIAEMMPRIIRDFPWPRSMRWGVASANPGSLRWVRPLQSIVCTFGPETEEPTVVDFEIDGIRAGNVTYGHRFHAPEAITVRRFEDYVAKLEAAKVIVDAERRKRIIQDDARNLAFANGLELVEDEGLLEEVSGLVEWPVVLMGEFEEEFLEIPAEVIRLTIRANQKCFVCAPTSPLRGGREAERSEGGAGGGISPQQTDAFTPTPDLRSDPPHKGEGKLSNRFILTANIEAKDGGKEIAFGNGKVVRARLSDALYFWKTDQADLPDLGRLKESAEKFGLDLEKPLDQRMARLDHLGVTFHAKLGTQGERVERIRRLARELASIVAGSMGPSSGPSDHLLPGGEKSGAVMPATSSPLGGEGGSAKAEPGEGDIIALAARAAVLAKADLQTEVVGEFPELQGAMGRKYAALQGEHPSVAAAIEEHYKPLGPSDIVPTDPVSVAVALADKLDTLVGFWAIDEKPTGSKDPYALRRAALGVIRIVVENGIEGKLRQLFTFSAMPILRARVLGFAGANGEDAHKIVQHKLGSDLLDFFHDRLKVYLRDKGARHDLIDSVITPEADDLLLIVSRVAALGVFLDTEAGKNLLAGTKRAANILAAEEKKNTRIADAVDPALLTEKAEIALFAAVNQAEKEAGQAIQKQDFSAAMAALAALREPVDSFFEEVLVNVEDEAVRANRLALLERIRSATTQVADFSKIAG